MGYSQVNGIWTRTFNNEQLGVDPGVTTVGAATLTNDIDFKGFREFSGQLGYTLGGGCTLALNFSMLDANGSLIGNGMGITLSAGPSVAFNYRPGLYLNGAWDIYGVGSGNFITAGQIPVGACETLRVRVLRIAGGAESTIQGFALTFRS